jgi:hypothetical protein
MRLVAVSSLLVAIVLVGCQKPAAEAASPAAPAAAAEVAAAPDATPKKDREHVDADGVVRRGAKLTEGTALTVAEAIAKASEIDGKAVKITGKVENVCQAMGCWFTITAPEGGQSIRISSKGHDIFVPKAAAGRVATVDGEFKVRTLSKEQAQHFEDERELKAGEAKKTFTEDVKELSIAITALEMKPTA